MKIKLIAFLCLISFAAGAQWNYHAAGAQVVAGSYKDAGKKATQITTSFSGELLDNDNDNTAVQEIGFPFKYNGLSFTQFVLNTNGFIKLGNVAPSSKTIYYPTAVISSNGAINAKDSNLIYPFNRNLTASEKGAEYKVITTGGTGSKVCTIQFKNLADKINPSQYASISFQIKLYEGTNVIEFVYDEWLPTENAPFLSIAAVGIKGNSPENSVNVAKGSGINWNNEMGKPSMPYYFLDGNYTSKGPNFGNKSSALPGAGHTYRFTPSE